MNTINCRVKKDEHTDIGVVGCTPAEAMILRAMHAPADARFAATAAPDEAGQYWKSIINPVAAGVALTLVEEAEPAEKAIRDEDGKVIEPAKPAKPATYRERTNAEEVVRLRGKYNQRAKSGAAGTHFMDDLFGPNPQLPETFEVIGLEVEPPDDAGKAVFKARKGDKSAQKAQRLADKEAELNEREKALAAREAALAKGDDGKKGKKADGES